MYKAYILNNILLNGIYIPVNIPFSGFTYLLASVLWQTSRGIWPQVREPQTIWPLQPLFLSALFSLPPKKKKICPYILFLKHLSVFTHILNICHLEHVSLKVSTQVQFISGYIHHLERVSLNCSVREILRHEKKILTPGAALIWICHWGTQEQTKCAILGF